MTDKLEDLADYLAAALPGALTASEIRLGELCVHIERDGLLRALAFLRGRSYVLPEDVTDIAPDVLRHRLVLSYEALSDGLNSDQLILRIMKHLPAPERPLETHVRVGANA